MVRRQLYNRGIRDQGVLKAFGLVPRERFVPEKLQAEAYGDHPLPIGQGQTISQPFVVAYMLQSLQLQPTDRVLEIGTGSGYMTALLSELTEQVYSVELFPELAENANIKLCDLGYENFEIQVGNGALGWGEHGPYNAIAGSAAGREIPPRLFDQLQTGGRLIMPVGEHYQQLILAIRETAGVHREPLLPVRFVPLRDSSGD